MSRRYAILDSATMGANLSVEQSGEVLAIDAASLAKRSAVLDLGVTGDVHRFEAMFWGDTDSLTDNAAVGVATGSFATSGYVGADAESIGYLPAEGQIHVGGVSVASVTVGAKGDIVGIVLDLETAQVFFFLNGAQIHVEALDDSGWTGATWYGAVSLGSDAEADLQAFVNTGQRGFEYDTPLSDGYYSAPTTIAAQWIGTEDYATHPDDTPANQRVEGLIPEGQGLAISRKLGFWPSGDSGVSAAVATLTIINDRDGDSYRFDPLIADTRDLPVTIYEGDRDDPFADFTTLGTFVLERPSVVDDGHVRLTFKSRDALLDQPLQRKLFLPHVEGQAANRPKPTSLGACYSITPVLYDAANLHYAIHDEPLLGIGFVRDRGDKLDDTASVPDFSILPDFTGVELESEPIGKVTVDASSIGGDLPTPPTNLAPANLAAWDDSDSVTEAGAVYTFEDSGAGFAGIEAYLKATAVLTAGKTYRYSITLTSVSGFFGGTGQKARLELAGAILTSTYPWVTMSEVRTYSGTFTSFGHTDLVLRMIGTGATFDEIKVSASITLYEVDNTGVDSDNLLPITLADFMGEIMERAGFTDDEWSRADAEAIDTATGYAGIGYHTQEQVTVREALEAVLPSYSACIAQDRNGKLRVFRLTAPEDRSADSEGSITFGEILEPGMKVTPYDAPALTTRFGCRVNETVLDPTDIVNDYDPVTGVTMEMRRRLGRKFQDIVATGGTLAAGYAHARGAEPHATRFASIADAQAELDRVRDIFASQRFLYEVDVPIETSGQYDLDQIWLLTYTDLDGIDRYSLGDGKYVAIHEIIERPSDGRATLVLFG